MNIFSSLFCCTSQSLTFYGMIFVKFSSSEEVEHRLERECGQIYSPIKNHPFFQQVPPVPSHPYNSHQRDDHQRDQKNQSQQMQAPKVQPHQSQAKTSTAQKQQHQHKKGTQSFSKNIFRQKIIFFRQKVKLIVVTNHLFGIFSFILCSNWWRKLSKSSSAILAAIRQFTKCYKSNAKQTANTSNHEGM